MAVVRILTYNLRSLRDDVDALARVVRAERPDILVAQEAPRFARWRPKCAALARACGMVYVAGGRTAGDNLLLADVRVSVDPARTWERRVPRPRLRPRGGVVGAMVEVADARLAVVGCHLGLTAAERRVEATEVADVVDSLGAGHAVVAGDLNEPPGGPSWRALNDAGLGDPRPDSQQTTFPSSAPRARIDAVLVSDGISILDYGVPSGAGNPPRGRDYARATDHLPVLAVLDVPADRR